jgi:2-polyprenyl-3-methyl-5-hydroxy-6-metoxy-1,4-benzoquinol methylase
MMKLIIKEVTPPIITRLIKKLRVRYVREKNAEFYDRVYDGSSYGKTDYDEHYTESRYYPLWTIIVDRLLKQGNNTSILDIGCGPGQFASFLRDKGFVNYLGVDFSPVAIAQARRVCSEFEFVVADMFQTDIPVTHTYNAVICMEFLEHVEEDIEILRRIRSGTYFLGTVPNFPFEAHVRYFHNANDVDNRYKTVFECLSVDTHFADKKGKQFFLMDGIIV